jgi:sulfate adenylyltransferase
MISPYSAHGGPLVNLIVGDERAGLLKTLARNFQSITLSPSALFDLELLLNGAFSPLKGVMTRNDYESVLDRMRLQDNTIWPIPVCLGVSELEAHRLEAGQSVALRDNEGFMLAVLHIQDVWPIEKEREAEAVYGTRRLEHAGVRSLLNAPVQYYVGGSVEGIQLPLHAAFKNIRHSPAEMRYLFKRLGWRRVVGFHTRHPLHRMQYELTLRAMAQVKANLLLHPVAGNVFPEDIDANTRIHCYLAAGKNYPANMMHLSLIPLATRMAGPREALWHAIIRKNYGCTHFIVGPHHASPGPDAGGTLFYERDAAVKLALSCSDALGIEIVPVEEMVYVPDEDMFLPYSEVPDGMPTRVLSNDEFHFKLRNSRKIPEWFSFPDVIDAIQQAYPPRHKQGLTIFFTGLSGAGKSTVARILYARFLEMRSRSVTLLDGDIVRQNLSSELGFSKEHRDINVKRIGYVASEITKNRGIAICAPIAPYTATRQHIRQLIQQYGGFIEVHVGTPIDVCESRDRKGLYAKARAGLIKEFTGVSDPYEVPDNPEVYIDTTDMTPDEAAQEVLLYMERAGYTR